MTLTPSPNEANPEGTGSASSRDRLRAESSGEKPVLTPPRVRSLSSENGIFSSYLVLVRKLDQKYEERGELDPLTWDEVDAQICEDPRLSKGQMRLLHDHCRNRLRLAGGGWG